MKFEPWVPSFMRKIAEIWREDSSRDIQPLKPPGTIFVYGIRQPNGWLMEVKSKSPIPGAKLLRVEDA